MAGHIKKALLLALAAPVMLLVACAPEAEVPSPPPETAPEPAANIAQPVPVPTVESLPSPAVTEPAVTPPRPTPKPVIPSAWENTEFGFTLEYGLTGKPKTIIDTVNYTYRAGDNNIALVFTDDELAEILRRMNEIDFFDYPEVLKDKPEGGSLVVDPATIYSFRVKLGEQTKILRWQDEYFPVAAERGEKLRQLIYYIQDLVEIKAEERRDADFGFVFNWGVGSGDTLDTFHGTYTRDMVKDPPVSTNLTLTAKEMALIEDKMLEIGFFDYPRVFRVEVPEDGIVGMVTPASSYSFTVKNGDVFKELWWTDSITNDNEQADKLRELIRLIEDIIYSKPEYQQLPSPRAGYC